MRGEAVENIGLETVMNTVLDGLIIIDDKGIIQSFNPASERIFGYQPEEVIGKNVKVLMPDPYHAEHDTYISNHLETGEKKIIGMGREVSACRKDGSIFPIELGVNGMEIDGKRMFVGTIRDISDRVEGERLRTKLVSRLVESNRELERFAYVASHDLQEPLRMVRNFTALLKKKYQGKLDAQAQQYIDISFDAAKRMQDLVEGLLEYARLENADEKLELVDVRKSLEYAMANLSERIEETKATITHDDLPTIEASPVQFARLIQNLISNAIKYQKSGAAPVIHFGAKNLGESWLFWLKDNGIGMRQEYCKQIFEPFKRLHSKMEFSGTGIGLAVCHKIVERMEGEMWAESKEGAGSCFYFNLPKSLNEVSEEEE